MKILKIHSIESEKQIPLIPKSALVVDSIFGTGLSRKTDGIAASVIEVINASGAKIFSVDVPSGMFCDKPNAKSDVVVHADYLFTFHAPKLAFLFPDAAGYVKHFEVLDIGLHAAFEKQLPSAHFYITEDKIRMLVKPRGKFAHKGNFGHALIAAGSFGKMGAAVLSVRAALRSGCGLVTALVPECGYEIMQTSNAEAMVEVSGEDQLYSVPDREKFNAVGVGCGIGMTAYAVKFMSNLLHQYRMPIVLDADALNILSEHKKLLKQIPENSILTPHPGEFRRLAGDWKNDFERLEKQKMFSEEHKVIVVLKGAHTSVSTPDRKIYFNSTGNSGMAKGGSGDVLTGIITALLAQKYSSLDAALLGVFVHGFAGDIAAKKMGKTSMTASDIINALPEAFVRISM